MRIFTVIEDKGLRDIFQQWDLFRYGLEFN